MSKGLTFTVVFEAQSLNYDEGFGNLSVLKKLRRGSGEVFTFMSRQSLRYTIFNQGVHQFGWRPSDVELAGERGKQVVQHRSDITKSEEVDLFGYMKTNINPEDLTPELEGLKGTFTLTRRAPVRITPAISLEPFLSDVEMLTNKYQTDKIHAQPNIANMEHHRSLYRYTVVIELNRIGSERDSHVQFNPPEKEKPKEEELKKIIGKAKEKLCGIELNEEEKCRRVQQFLEIIKTLHRSIRGREESLSPLFIIGGLYDCQHPFFINAISLSYKQGKPFIELDPIKEILESKYAYGPEMKEKTVKEDTYIGIRSGYFANSIRCFKELFGEDGRVLSPEGMIDKLKEEVGKFFRGER
ncbi:type I-B CRISPR-associated protein Cas7/Cst2/DevR [Candidatus Poribacteria bacterium]|nr:MAG: type I-B CRISPR-associated protein Cas7/Cst2/DevR [Candidatus Poribacteria bacterium]